MRRRATTILVATAAMLCAQTAIAFKPAFHAEASAGAMPFLKLEIASALLDGNEDEDTAWKLWRAGIDKRHFNDCGFAAAGVHLRESYEALIKELAKDKPDYEDAAEDFGRILHTAQDFYAHSNWVEAGQTGLLAPRDEAGWPLWPQLGPYKVFGNAMLLEDDNSPPPAIEPDKAGPRRFLVKRGGREYQGIVSGSVAITKHCFPGADIGHWKSLGNMLASDRDHAEGLNKDQPPRPHFFAARDLALAQSKVEWCRLLAALQAMGKPAAVTRLLEAWTTSPAAAQAACNAGATPG
jgi:hypothetical protein